MARSACPRIEVRKEETAVLTRFLDLLREHRELKRRMRDLLRHTTKVRKCDYYRPSIPDPIHFTRHTQYR